MLDPRLSSLFSLLPLLIPLPGGPWPPTCPPVSLPRAWVDDRQPFLGRLGAVLELSWAVWGSWKQNARFLNFFGARLGPSWGPLGPFWAPLGPSWGPLGPSWGHLGGLLGRLGAVFGASWAVLERREAENAKTPKSLKNN